MTMKQQPEPHGPVPSKRQLAWHRREIYGFVHFTVNTFSGKEWGYGDEPEALFNPVELDCHQWVAAAKAGGLTGLILTAKHHDGFCLWPSRTTRHHIGASPYMNGQGDLVRSLAEACRDGGIDFGVYCSPWDRNHPDYGTPAYVDAYHQQWQELLTGYGPLFACWYDGANGGDGYYGGAREKRSIDAATYYRFDPLWQQVRQHQPQAFIFSDAGPDVRWCGNESGMTGLTHWAKVRPEGFIPGQISSMQRLVVGDADGSCWRPAECDVSLRPGWFWHRNEKAKSGDELFSVWLASVGRGANLNLNLTPDQRGLIPTDDVLALTRFRQKVAAFTAIDLARGQAVQASSTAAGAADCLTDGDPDTYWQSGTETADIVVQFNQQEKIGGIRIEEAIAFGQRVEAFALDILYGSVWYEAYHGTTIGARRICPITPVPAQAVRLRLLKSQARPVLSSLQVYASGG